MDELIKTTIDEVLAQGGRGDVLGLGEVFFSLCLCLLCALVICVVYRYTHKSIGYSQSFVQTLILTALITTLIMIIIGSNIARAFSLVGALSIIRFRNAIKETRDVGYIFFVMAIAMACGTRFYSTAILATVFVCVVLIIMFMLDFATSRKGPDRLLRIQLPHSVEIESVLGPVLKKLFKEYSFILVETVRQGMYVEAHLAVRPHGKTTSAEVIDAISKVNGNLKISYHLDSSDEDI